MLERTVVLTSHEDVLDISQPIDVVERMLDVHGMRNRRHGHHGSEELRRPHLVRRMPKTSLLWSFEAPKTCVPAKNSFRKREEFLVESQEWCNSQA